jgi:DNA-binding PadR family transcriptional regulator
MMNGIKPGTFYNWIKRLRKRGITDIAPPAGRNRYEPTPKQEVVRIDLQGNTEPVPVYEAQASLTDNQPIALSATIELIINGNPIRVANNADPELLLSVIRILKGLPC